MLKQKKKYKRSNLSLKQLEDFVKLSDNESLQYYVWYGLHIVPEQFIDKFNTSYRFNISVLYLVTSAYSSGDLLLFHRMPYL